MGIIKTLIVDPKKFITPPYWDCPKCGAEDSFGVLSINEQSYIRRCKKCWYDDSYSLPKLSKKVIYIDQFAISNMMHFLNPETKTHKKGNLNKFWGELFSKLDKLCKLQLIICPDSAYHEDESIVFFKYYKALKKMYELLSHGTRFISEDEIKKHQICEYAKIWAKAKEELILNIDDVTNEKVNKWLPRFIISVQSTISSELIKDLKATRNETNTAMSELFKKWQQEKEKTFKDWFNEKSSHFGPKYLYDHNKMLQDLLNGEFNFDSESIHILKAVKFVLHETGVEEKELSSKTYEYFHSPIWKEIPFVRIMSMLFASIARKAAKGGQKNPPDRGTMFDFRLISEFLPYCDAMFIDKRSHAFLKESPLNKEIKEYGTEVFSLNNKEEFMKYLNQIENDASPEHMIKVKEVYGEENLKPYTTMYEKS